MKRYQMKPTFFEYTARDAIVYALGGTLDNSYFKVYLTFYTVGRILRYKFFYVQLVAETNRSI